MKSLLTISLVMVIGFLQAQVQILAEQDQDRNLTLFAINSAKIPYTVRLDFVKLQNLESMDGDIILKVVMPGKSNLVKLRSILVNENTSFNYNTKLYKGTYLPSDLAPPAYLVPMESGRVFSMRPLKVQLPGNAKNAAAAPYSGVGFFFEKLTVVCAPRKGIISEIKMDKKNPSEGPVDFDSENYVEIYHPDGTFSRLSGLKSGSARVEVGETVIPGQALADSAPEANQTSHHVKMIQSKWENNENGIIWVNFPVIIFTEKLEAKSDETHLDLQSTHPGELITKEMDKKELKKYLAN